MQWVPKLPNPGRIRRLHPMGDTPRRLDRGAEIVTYTITVDAPAQELWAIAANPHRHHELDGSGTVRSRAIGPRQLLPEDRFRVDMKKFGLPYALTLRVTESRPPQSPDAGEPVTGVVEWRQPTGHRWRWEFAPAVGPDGTVRTEVTESYDASGQQPVVRRFLNAVKVAEENAQGIRDSLQGLHNRFA